MKHYFVTRSCAGIDATDILSKIRCETLDRAYAVPGYKTLTHIEKRRVYDAIRTEVMKEYGMEA